MGEEIARLHATIGADISGFKRALQRVEDDISGTKRALVGLGAAIVGAFAASNILQAGQQLEKTMANIRAVTGATAKDMGALQAQIVEMGKNSTLGVQATADAFYDVAGSVDDASLRMAILEKAMATAEAGQADLAGATKGLVSVMNSYGYSAGQAGMVSDVFTRTVGLGVGTMDEFVSAMSPIVGILGDAGIEFQDVGTMMAWMTKKGATASQAATRLTAATTALLKPNEAMKKALKAIGAESGTAAIKQWGLAGVLGRLQTVVGGSSDKMAEMLGTVEALGAASAINGRGFEDFMGTFQDGIKGATEAARKLQLESPAAQFEIMLNQLRAIGPQLGQVLMGALAAVPKIIKELWDSNILGIPKAIESAIEAVKKPFADLSALVGDFFDNIFNPKKTDPGEAWAKQFGQSFTKQKMAELVGGEEIGPTFGDRIQAAIEAVGPRISQALANLGNSIKGWFVATFQPSPEVLKAIEILFTPISEGIKTLASVNWPALFPLAAGMAAIFGAIKLLPTAVHLMGILSLFGLVAGALKGIGDAVTMLQNGNILGAITKFLEGLLTVPMEIARAIIPDLDERLATWRDIFEKQIPALIDGLKKKFAEFGDNVRNALKSVAMGFITFIEDRIITIMQLVGLAKAALGDKQGAIEIAQQIEAIKAARGAAMESNAPPVPLGPPAPPPAGATAPPPAPGQGLINPLTGKPYNIPGRAIGGPVAGGRQYMVGERGPELFTPRSPGFIVPNRQMAGAGNVNITLNANGINNPIELTNMIQRELKRRNA